ncbi:MAG TPA: hypothetical protein DEQ38_01950 [Elusimicrobia bacterium]|nr:MAG: hypothetical protein A2089_07515 [Elusimicrobia bacterium GWD2_63_28]HCC46871.1 hypothetical protein [Elusimicrobiota bacterium]
MKNLIILQFRKSLLPFSVLAGAVLLSVPAALLFRPDSLTGPEAVNIAMLFWALAGLPLAIMALAGAAGSDASSDAARASEQPLPESQYRQVLAGLAAAAAQTALLILAIYAIMGFSVPLDKLNFVNAHVASHYFFYAAFLALYAFTLSYALRNAVAGGIAAAALLAVTAVPLLSASLFSGLMLDLVPMAFLNSLTGILVLAGTLGALSLLCRAYARKEAGRAVKALFAALLLAAPALPPFIGLAILRGKSAEVTWPVFPLTIQADAPQDAPGVMLVQKPFTGEVFLIDEEGRRAAVFPDDSARGLPNYFFPVPAFVRGQTMAGPDGSVWVYADRYDKPGVLMNGSAAGGLKLRAAMPDSWRANFVRGKVPGIVERRKDGYYYAQLTPGDGPLKWENVKNITGEAAKRWITGTGAEALLDAFLRSRLAEAPGVAVLAADGRTVTAGGGKWTVPGALGPKAPLIGLRLGDGMSYVVPAREGKGYAAYLCPPGKAARRLWGDYFRPGANLWAAPDGTLWGYSRKSSIVLTVRKLSGASKKEFDSPQFNILTREGKSIESFRLDNVLRDLPEAEGDIALVREEKGELWFTIGNGYLVKTGANPNGPYSAWRFPESVREKYWRSTLLPTRNGILIAAMDGVHFMDWEGKAKRL